MIYPSLNKQQQRTVGVPALSGGLNLRDALTAVGDNQLTDCKNVWFSDGSLKTRPSLTSGQYLSYSPLMYDETASGRPTDITVADGGQVYRLYYYTVSGERKTEALPGPSLETEFVPAFETGFFWVSPERVISMPPLPSELSFVIQSDGRLYAFLQVQKIYSLDIFPLGDSSQWDEITEEYTAPRYLINCYPSGADEVLSIEALEQNGAERYEDFNILSPYYKMIYSSVNTDAVNEENKTHPMVYSLLYDVSDAAFREQTVTAAVRDKSGRVFTHSVKLENGYNETASPGDGRLMKLSGKKLYFVNASGGQTATVSAEDYLQDNLEITAPRPFSAEGKNRLFGMRRAVWFGGDATGLHGGTRLFLGCNNSPSAAGGEKNLVMWSELLNPLYFAENSFAKLGDSNQRVTAFGRQTDMLVIFKERETFFTKYTQTSSSEDGKSPSMAIFPMMQLNSAIGCDCPDTVQLCRNRLVWACSDGRVYTLVGENQYNEHSIYSVSAMIEPRLKSEKKLETATSADWNGHYFLFAGKDIYVMDYESYGYANAASYTKTEDAERGIPWWYWELSEDDSRFAEYGVQSGFAAGNTLMCVYYNAGGLTGGFEACRFDGNSGSDLIFFTSAEGDFPIESSVQTKLFDFGSPSVSKTVPLISVAFGADSGESAEMTFITGQGETGREQVRLAERSGGVRSPEYIRSRHFRPPCRILDRIALRIESRGLLSVSSLSLTYRLLGLSR